MASEQDNGSMDGRPFGGRLRRYARAVSYTHLTLPTKA